MDKKQLNEEKVLKEEIEKGLLDVQEGNLVDLKTIKKKYLDE